jgi:hypothetical protein
VGWRIEFLTGQLWENKAYGHQAVFARYCKRRTEELKIFARYQHGFIKHPLWNDSRIRSLVWSDYILKEHKNVGVSNIYAIGAPIIYYSKKSITKNENLNLRNFSLCVAPHSTFNQQKSIFDGEDFKNYFPDYMGGDPLKFYIDKCLEQSSHQPLVLLFYKDVSNQTIERFNNYGIKTVSLGDGIFNSLIQETYFDNMINILKAANEVLVCDTNSIWAYSGYLGKHIVAMNNSIFWKNYEYLNSKVVTASGTEANFFDILMGVSNRKTPEELLELFGSSSIGQELAHQFEFVKESGKNLMKKFIG